MITTYEQNFINERLTDEMIIDYFSKLTEDELAYFIKNRYKKQDRVGFCEDICVVSGKSMLELCFEIKPITFERLNAISVDQWNRWADKYENNKNYTHLFLGLIDLKMRINEESIMHELFLNEESIMHELFLYLDFIRNIVKLIHNISHNDLLGETKAIHDLVWELEHM